ncbi:alkylhydroperoxidase AhpD family core domain-containing protein [Gracilibacillus orientalis]|uniref:Alkylhydroperoxidase AhpD family core domain-containing protein n=1 Tax=Gracilibacillus orientalis TaxID=334253 RepID=A0A1I4L4E7_9BACI|nr:carboxymuconolactone decarboxylase family protein [Gracilibacillus orientalis]SFL85892.1 alkylhydroperoxidase AhpD family core domain-containing protein [Gracilibacillus orientalis]
MEQRINYMEVAPDLVKLIGQLEMYKKQTEFDEKLIELVKIRASQLNNCAYCINMHTKDARALGETEQRIYCLSAWRETDFYTESEKAALELTEAITKISEQGVPDKVYQKACKQFDEKQYIDLVGLIITINCWNRLSIANHNVPE